LLKEFDRNGFVFFTHYNSPKAIQAEKTGVVALNFHWPLFSRQIRIKGKISRISTEESEKYFLSRPKESQINTLASKQSTVIPNRESFEKHIQELTAEYKNKEIHCPAHWGGYRVIPFEFEFFQGRDFRLNDRFRYSKTGEQWKIERLSP
jgi:pyridoxamine 5'-phosphate oxidase